MNFAGFGPKMIKDVKKIGHAKPFASNTLSIFIVKLPLNLPLRVLE
jgi:hypothetical protein